MLQHAFEKPSCLAVEISRDALKSHKRGIERLDAKQYGIGTGIIIDKALQ